jgi:hypothetical protein
MAQVNTQLTVSGIDKPPDITETYEEWLTRRRAELDELERAAIGLESTEHGERPAGGNESAITREPAKSYEGAIDGERTADMTRELKFR